MIVVLISTSKCMLSSIEHDEQLRVVLMQHAETIKQTNRMKNSTYDQNNKCEVPRQL